MAVTLLKFSLDCVENHEELSRFCTQLTFLVRPMKRTSLTAYIEDEIDSLGTINTPCEFCSSYEETSDRGQV